MTLSPLASGATTPAMGVRLRAGADGGPLVARLPGPFGFGLTVDVEEWYHTCHVPEYVDPRRRPRLAEELDFLLPELLDLLAEARRHATFFVLGEVARRLPARVREIAERGHEVAAHGHLHLRAETRSPAAFTADLERCRKTLEDLLGVAPRGFRAPEWSLRRTANPRLRLVAEQGFEYDSSLAPYAGAGSRANPVWVSRVLWPGGAGLVEFPPLSMGGILRLPATGWAGRLATPAAVVRAAAAHRAGGGLPVLVVHPWEISSRPTPGELTGLARFLHETGRSGYRRRFAQVLAALPWEGLRRAFGGGAGDGDDRDTGSVPVASAGAAE